ncbi:Regulator of sigma-E protease RseP [Roseobacter fucihabitans]|uniref:Zinc metalloprotease n=1 Tax=Roseobacter fucihabitans TaxID=1537242 RepID=A0ABZ2BTD1_9RHOB|nr:RIP metalloprotease RseP [Roseobacter litoralis]MBC6965751.1 Regulator of sigma-E protease RseP [Roseobacter litoralis]
MDILALIPQFGGFIWTIAAFVLALSVIVAIHEYGHYIVGRWSGIHADVFSLGFGPVLYSRVDRRGTRWQIAALPFGGYVKFAGDANAASGRDDAAMAQAANDPVRLRATMHGAPLWARTATVAAGPLFNFALSILVFAAVVLTSGVARDQLAVGELRPLPVEQRGLEVGDEILRINGAVVPSTQDAQAYADFIDAIPQEAILEYTVRRDGSERRVADAYILPPLVNGVSPQSPALSAGLEVGDVITAIDGAPIFSFAELKVAVEGGNGAPLALTIWRAGDTLDVTLTPKRVDEPQPEGGFATQWRIGIAGGLAFEAATQTPGVGEALMSGVRQTGRIIEGSLSGLGHMITGAISTCNLSGPIGIAQTSGAMASQGAQSFIWFIAVLSTAVGLLNLFPVPALDGGHLVFYAYEAVTGKPPSDKALRVLMTFGLATVLTLMVFALGNDLFCP